MRGYPCKICGDFPVNSKLITCKSYIFFNAISTCVPKVRNYGDFRQHVIPTIITCMLRGTPCDTGFTRSFYRGNICSVTHKSKVGKLNFFCLKIYFSASKSRSLTMRPPSASASSLGCRWKKFSRPFFCSVDYEPSEKSTPIFVLKCEG